MTDAPLRSGIDPTTFDPAVRAQDDLYRHVNGGWLATAQIPEDKSRWGSFNVLADEAEAAVKQIILDSVDAEPGTLERTIGDLYTSFMDEDAIRRRGCAPLAERLAEVDAVGTVAELAALVGRLQRGGVPGLLAVFIDTDPGDPSRYLIHLEQSGISLPDESYYREESFAETREAYRAHIERLLALASPERDDSGERAERVFELETAIAATHWDNVATRDSQATYNLLRWDAAAELSGRPALLAAWRDGVLGDSEGAMDEVIVREPDAVTGLGALLVEDRLAAWKDWLSWKVVHASAAYLTDDFVAENFDFYGRTLSGVPRIRERWKRGVSLVEGSLGEAVGRAYVQRHFPEESKTQMDVLVANLVEAYRDSISTLDWMSEATRERALAKLDLFTPKIGYPDRWRDYDGLVIDAGDLIGNVARVTEFEYRRELAKIGSPVDRDEWFMTPQTVNAYYNPGFNEIVFPAAILQFPFFDPERDPAANYGAIGAVIGHEIGHGFDDQGSRYDGEGRLLDWWTPEDRAAFEERTAALIEQYDALAPEQTPGHHVNGALTIGENIGDLGGLSIAWKAYQRSLAGADAPIVDGLSGAERFFLSWAQAWQQKARDAEVIRLLAIDPHSPNEFRCNQIVRNLDAFAEAFGLAEGDGLWLDPASRVAIW
ncbi:M13 family metallopeptidase [Mycetocola reblochoni]|uniref:Metallopeptidase n=2 Tax=Mycetocola reblochoni TaxID=331618 RepID=A0A1R4J2L4_9MICO|nr:M13-type metalloendopeptidase [Mycetocola reblochoni]RLP71232.1 peptidase M13 [Mycetocola reblochoni]SJN25995.1 Metallopeptidase [Mycetocola reblochoni REB411]